MATNSVGSGVKSEYTVAICCTTFRRPKLLRKLLHSWQNLTIPDHVLPVFVVVENHREGHCRELVKSFSDHFSPHKLVYEIATDPGIPTARNTAIKTALAQGAELILFVDDDEIADGKWLSELIKTYLETGAALIGGPVYARFDNDEDGFLAKIMRNGLKARYDRIARRAAKKLASGKADEIAIDTSNWLADAKLFTEYDLSFDPSLSVSGGSDTKFYHEVRKLKVLKTTWSPDAIVYETVPRERLTPGYQYYRGMQQSRNSIHHKLDSRSRLHLFPFLVGNIFIRMVTITLLILALPFNLAPNFVRILRSAGWITGRITGFFGARSNLYEAPSGDL